MEKGKGLQVAIPGAQIRRSRNGEHTPERAFVGMHNALREPRGPGGVHDVQRVLVPGPQGRRRRRALIPESRVIPCARHGRGSNAQQPGQARSVLKAHEGIHRIGKFIIKNERGRAAVLEDETEFFRRQAPVQGHHHSAQARDGEEAFDKLGAVHEQEPHPISGFDAVVDERVSQTMRAFRQFKET